MADLLSFFGDIGKKLHGIEAQLNPWDNGQDYNSVVNNVSQPAPKPVVQPRPQIAPQMLNPQGQQQWNQQHGIQAPPLPPKPVAQSQLAPVAAPKGDWLANAYEQGGLGGFLAGGLGAARDIAAGVQQSLGSAGDVALQGGALVNRIGIQTNPLINGQQRQQKLQNFDKSLTSNNGTTNQLRNTLHNQNDLQGNRIVGTSDVDQSAANIANGHASPQDIAAVLGKSLDVANAATMFANPASLTKNTLQQGIKSTIGNTIKTAAKDSLFYGGTNGLAAGADTYGQTGDLGRSLLAGGKAAALAGLTQGALEIGAPLAGVGIRNVAKSAPKVAGTAVDAAKYLNPSNIVESHPAVIQLQDHYSMLKQADDQMAQRGLSSNNPARIQNAKAQIATLNQIGAVKKQIMQGGYAKIPGSPKASSPEFLPNSKQSSPKDTQPQLLPQSDTRLSSGISSKGSIPAPKLPSANVSSVFGEKVPKKLLQKQELSSQSLENHPMIGKNDYREIQRTSGQNPSTQIEKTNKPQYSTSYSNNTTPTDNVVGRTNSHLNNSQNLTDHQASALQRGIAAPQKEVKASIEHPQPQPTIQDGGVRGVAKTSEISSTKLVSQDQRIGVKQRSQQQTKTLSKDNTYGNDTTRQRGFTTSVKNSDEVSSQVRKGTSGTYKVRNTADLAVKADTYARGNLKKVTQEVNDSLAKKTGTINDNEIANAIAVAKRHDAAGNYDQSQQIYDQLAEHGTKGGQAIQAFSLLRNRTPEGMKFQAIRMFKKAGVKLTDEDEKRLGSLIDEVKKTKVGTKARDIAIHNTFDFVSRRIPTNAGDKFVNFWRAGLLTSPITTGGNIVGNTTEALTRDLWTNPIATATDKFFSIFTGKRTKMLAGGELSGAKSGIQKGANYLKTGFDERRAPNLKYDAPQRVNYKNKVLDGYVNGVYKWMGAQDQPFYYAAEQQATRDLAKADAKNLGLTGQAAKDYVTSATKDPSWKPQTFKSKSGRETAAKYAVYQNDTLLGHMAGGLKKYASQHSGIGGAVANFLLPFSQVPSSVAMRIIDRTPLGVAKELVTQIKNKSFDQRAMSEAIANGSFGVPVFAAGAALAMSGNITGSYPSDPKERKLWQSEGKQEYSVKIGNRWYSLNYMQPFGTILSMGGQFQSDIKDGKSPTEAWNKVGATALNSVESQSFLQGINGVLSAVNNPDQSASQYVNSTLTSLVPNFIRTAARATDPNQRDTKKLGNALKGTIPGLRETTPIKQDMFGQPLTATDNLVNQLLNPLRPSKVKNANDPVVNELQRLQDSGNGIVPTDFDKSSIKGATLSDDQVRSLNASVNAAVQNAWKDIVAGKSYQSLSDEDKSTVLKKSKDAIAEAYKDIFARSTGVSDANTVSKSLSQNAKTIVNGGMPDFAGAVASNTGSGSNVSISPKLSADYTSTLNKYNSMSADDRAKTFRSTPDAEYQYNLAKYNNDKVNGDISSIQDISKAKSIAKDKVGSVYPKDVRDLYGMSKADISTYLATPENNVDKQKMAKQLIAYDQALYNAGLESSLKFKTGIAPSKGGSSKSSGIKPSASLTSMIKASASIKPPTPPPSKKPTGTSYKSASLKKYAATKPTISKAKISVRKGMA